MGGEERPLLLALSRSLEEDTASGVVNITHFIDFQLLHPSTMSSTINTLFLNNKGQQL